MRKVHALSSLVLVTFFAVGCKSEADRQREIDAASSVVPAQAPEMPDQVAKVGVGVKGNSLDDIQGDDPRMILAGPAKAYFNVREKVVFDIQLPHQSSLFYASNGRHPKSHEEYMKEIVGPIELPKLPSGKVYQYHPETNELWVVSENPQKPTVP